jgi:hypothetical protein
MASAQGGGYLSRPEPSGLADVIEIVLDKGIVIDAYVRVSLVGIELLTIDARVVVASVDTYLRFAEATNRLDLWDKGGRSMVDMATEGVEDVVTSVASSVVEHKVDGAMETVGDTLGTPAEKIARSAAGKVVDVTEGVVGKVIDVADQSEQEQ